MVSSTRWMRLRPDYVARGAKNCGGRSGMGLAGCLLRRAYASLYLDIDEALSCVRALHKQ
jgi:hypothetical protein